MDALFVNLFVIILILILYPRQHSTILYVIKRNERRSAHPEGRYPMTAYTDELLERKWRELGNVPIDYTPDELDGVLGTDWFIFEQGEPLVEGVWRWFDSHYTAGIGALMFGTDE